MERLQPTFGVSAFSSATFNPSEFESTPWNALLAPEPRAYEDDNDPHTKFLSLFNKNEHSVLQQPGLSPEKTHALRIAPLFSGAIYACVNRYPPLKKQPFSQYGVLGMMNDEQVSDSPYRAQEKLLFSNTEEPWSTFICGSQGSGKSHTLSCLLENNLLPDPKIGNLKTPLTGLVFHYDKFANFGNGQACEAAYLCSASNGGIPVQVLVAPTSLKRMAYQYHNLPGLSEGCSRPKVLPLYFSQKQLCVDTMMTLMAVNDDAATAPLYISAIRQLLRDIAMDSQDTPGFNYHDFRHRLACLALTEAQNGPLTLRLQLLQSFLLEEDQTDANRAAFAETWTFKPGTLTIIDLSDQFVNETDACALFSICLKLFMADWQSNPRIIALDEAHKFLTASTEATKLTSDLVSVIRQQRHMSARVIVATQEPTISETLLDLCNVSIIHRFNSPKWYRTLQQHLAGACVNNEERDAMFREIVKLSTGEALVFCPTAVLDFDSESGTPVPLQDGVVKILVRDRVSADGGQSIQASSRDHNGRSGPLPAMPEYQRFRGDKMPAPGSLARKPGAKSRFDVPKNNQAVTESSHMAPSIENARAVPPSEDLSVTSAKRQKTTDDGASSGGASSFNANGTASSSQHANAQAPSVPAAVPQVSTAPPVIGRQQKPASQIVIFSKQTLPQGHKYSTTDFTEGEMVRLMKKVVHETLRFRRLVRDPSGYLNHWLMEICNECGFHPRCLTDHPLPQGCQEVWAINILKRVVKQYYDERGVPQANRATGCTWLH